MKSLFSPRTAAFISLSGRGDAQWHAEGSSVPSRDARVSVFGDLTSLLKPKKGLRLLAACLGLKAESCKTYISEGIRRGLTVGGTCSDTCTSAGWRLPQALRAGSVPVLPLMSAAHSSPLRQVLSVIFLSGALHFWPPVEPESTSLRETKGRWETWSWCCDAGQYYLPHLPSWNWAWSVSHLQKGWVESVRLCWDICDVAQKVLQPLVMWYTTSLPDASTP